jgi:hypothetical protein
MKLRNTRAAIRECIERSSLTLSRGTSKRTARVLTPSREESKENKTLQELRNEKTPSTGTELARNNYLRFIDRNWDTA